MMVAWLLAAMLAQAPPTAGLARPLKAKLYRGAAPTQALITAAREKAKARGVALSGVHVAFDAKALNKGSWHKLPDGRALWLLEIESPGAKAVRLQFRDFAVGKGEVWIHAAGETGVPYTAKGPNGDGEFWSDTVHSAKVTLEFLPDGTRPAKLPFVVGTISHQL